MTIATGYAITASGERITYEEADAMQQADIETLPSVVAYHTDPDAPTVTTWTGGTLARVIDAHTYRGGFGNARMVSIRVRTPGGRELVGRYGYDWNQSVILRAVKSWSSR